MSGSPLDHLITLIGLSELSQIQFARAIGKDPRSVRRWLAGGEMSPEVADFILRIRSVYPDGDTIKVTVER